MTDCVIRTSSLTKTFRDFWGRNKIPAVVDLDLEVNRGSIFGLLGPNGSGKSTTFKLLLGLLHPSSGQVTVLGHPPKSRVARNRIGYLPEESRLYDQLTATEILHFYGGLFKMTHAEIGERTHQLLNMVGLAHAANRRVGTFSRGMARRIGLAQALLNDPDLLILDEPTAGLDPVGCLQIKQLLQKLSERGKTIIIASHLMADVQDICDRILLLHHGRSLVCGSLSDLLKSPDHIRFTMRKPMDDKVSQIHEAIRNLTGESPHMEHPSIALETYFVETVSGADVHHDEEFSGVAQSTELAPFLTES
jgi:ABC-2 type transport system ATP-binding protein